MITYRGYGGATVPSGGDSVGTSSGFTLTIQPGTLDVTVNATGPQAMPRPGVIQPFRGMGQRFAANHRWSDTGASHDRLIAVR